MQRKSLIFLILLVFSLTASAQNSKADGYKGIWFTLGQFSDYGDKYSGGLGTYTADHIPIAIYSPLVKKTFFVYGGTTGVGERHLLIMISYFDHKTRTVPKPVIVLDKMGINDPHDNAALSIDNEGFIWVFVSGRMRLRPGYIFKSSKPFSIDNFEEIKVGEMTYPQPWWVNGSGFLYLLTKYTNGRELYWTTSPDGMKWTDDKKLAGMGGHYQVTNIFGNKLVSVFNYHPGGNVDKRTNIYAVQTTDMGRTWKTIDGKIISTPLSDPHNEALIRDYEAEKKLVYINDLNFDTEGNPVILAVISNDFRPGPKGDPREWTIIHWKNGKWNFHKVCESTHNYDMGSLYIEKKVWRIIGPTEPGPQYYGAGGEIAMWESNDDGNKWQKVRDITSESVRNNSYVRRPLYANKDFYALWADGDADKLSESHLRFSNRKGDKVMELPYEMSEDNAVPKEIKASVIRRPASDNMKPVAGDRLPVAENIITRGYVVPEGSLQSELFSMKVNGNDVFTQKYKTYHYVHIITTRAFSVSLTSNEIISGIKISPVRFNISAATGKTSTSFVLPGPGYYVVRINEKHKLFIFAEPPDNEPTVNVVNVAELGINNKGVKVETSAIQKAMNDISGTGKTLLFPAGIYKSGSLSIPPNTNIYLSAGAVIKGVDEISAFDFKDNIKPKSFIRIKDATNVTISGRGVIDANGRILRDKYGDTARMRLLLVLNSRNIAVDGIFVRDPGSWNTHILNSENVSIRNVKMLNDIELSNTDGFDPDASRFVLIENCFAYCSDDNIAVKITGTSGYLQNTENITVRGCVFLTKKSSLKVGTESRGDVIRNVLFENNDVVESDRGMSLYCSDGALFEAISYIDNRFEDNYPDAKQSWMNFTITKRNPESKPGSMTGIQVKDCSFGHLFPKVSEISGFDKTHRISMTIENLKVGEIVCDNEKEANINNKGFADISFK